MVKWNSIIKDWKYQKPKYFWTHWFHDTYSENDPWWANEKNPKRLCRKCKVWWD